MIIFNMAPTKNQECCYSRGGPSYDRRHGKPSKPFLRVPQTLNPMAFSSTKPTKPLVGLRFRASGPKP